MEILPPAARYATAAPEYFAKGYVPLPLLNGKGVTPHGFTGYAGQAVTAEQVTAWGSTFGVVGTCLRMDGLIGLDVDAYDAKKNAASTWTSLQEHLGVLPLTVVSSSRLSDADYDGLSGIRLFRLPEEFKELELERCWRGNFGAGSGIDVVRRAHRQVNCWPARHRRGTTYCWLNEQTGEIIDGPLPVDVADLPLLPVPWCEALLKPSTGGSAGRQVKKPHGWFADTDELAELVSWQTPDEPCAAVQRALEDLLDDLPGSRHDVAVSGQVRLYRLGEQGHRGVGAALDELRESFIAELEGDPSRSEAPEAEWERAESGVYPLIDCQRTALSQRGCCGPRRLVDIDTTSGDSGDSTQLRELEARLFDASETLSRIRQAARARLASPWAVLGAVLVRVNAETAPEVVLPPVIFGRASLNLAVGLVDRSGGGKSGSVGLSDEVLGLNAGVAVCIGPGSGEGIIQTFLRWDKTLKRNVPADVRQALLVADEISQIGAVQERNGSTSGGVLRSMLTGSAVSTTNADPTRNRSLAAHSCRLAVLAGIQPELADVLLADSAAGTPQRWVWLPAGDPGMPDREPNWPGALGWVPPDLAGIPSAEGGQEVWPHARRHGGFVHVGLPAEVAEFVKDAHRKRQRLSGGPMTTDLDGHRILTRLKLAGTLALLHGAVDTTNQWWELAGVILEVSDVARGWCEQAVRDVRDREHVGRGRADAVREAAARAVRDDEAERHARKLWALVSKPSHSNMKHDPGSGCTSRCVAFALRHDRGADKAAAVRLAVELGWLEERESRWFAGPSQPSEVGS